MKKFLTTVTATIMSFLCVAFSACGDKKGDIKVNPDKDSYVVGIVQLVTHDAFDGGDESTETFFVG